MVADSNVKKNDVFSRLKQVIETLLQVSREKDLAQRSEITMETNIYEDLEIDSLEVMDMLAAIDEEFCTSLSPDLIQNKKTIADIVDLIYSEMEKD